MKKILAALLVLALVAPAMAVSFTLTPGAAGTGQLTVAYTLTAGEVLRGMALKVKVNSGDATIDATTDIVIPAGTFNTFIDYAFTNPSGYAVGMAGQHPLANPAAAGVLDLTTPKNDFVVSLGYLDQAGAQAGLTANGSFVITFALTTESVVEVSADTLRGGIVGDALVASNLPLTATLGVAPSECVKSTAPFYADWVTFGKPACWCFSRNCRGDINGTGVGTGLAKKWVTGTDLTAFKAAYNIANSLLPAGGVCADNNHVGTPATYGPTQKRVTGTDLTQFKLYYNQAESGPVTPVTICPDTNYNFWTN